MLILDNIKQTSEELIDTLYVEGFYRQHTFVG
jgi:hypothetical protein